MGMFYNGSIDNILQEYGIDVVNEGRGKGKHQITGKVYKTLGDHLSDDGTVKGNSKSFKDNIDAQYTKTGTTSLGTTVLDSVAQNQIGKIDVEKEKALLESKSLMEDYILYNNDFLAKAINDLHSGKINETNKLYIQINNDIQVLYQYGFDNLEITKILLNNYFGFDEICKTLNISMDYLDSDNPDPKIISKVEDCIRRILQLRLNYVRKLTSLMAKMIKNNYRSLGLSEEQAEIYISSLKSGGNDSVKTAEDVKKLIRENSDKYKINNGDGFDFRPLGFGVILGPSNGYKLNFVGTDGTNQDAMLNLLQQAMRYDVVVVAHGGDNISDDKYKKSEDDLNKVNEYKDNYLNHFGNNEYTELFDKIDNLGYNMMKSNRIVDILSSPVKNNITQNSDINEKVLRYIDNILKNVNDITKLSQNDVNKIFDEIVNTISQKIKSKIDLEITKNINKIKRLSLGQTDNGKIIANNELYKDILQFYNNNRNIVNKYIYSTIIRSYLNDIYLSKYNNIIKYRTWTCQPTKTLKAGPFTEVNELVRQLIKEGFKKIIIEDCNPGGHQLSDDIMNTKGIIINHSDFSNFVESGIIDSNDDTFIAINEAENSLKELSSIYNIDYNDDEYLEESIRWVYSNQDIVNEGVIDSLKDFLKKIISAIVGLFKKLIDLVKLAVVKFKELFTGTKEKPKDTKTGFQKPIETPLIDIKSRSVNKVKSSNREDLNKSAEASCQAIAGEIKKLSSDNATFTKEVEKFLEELTPQKFIDALAKKSAEDRANAQNNNHNGESSVKKESTNDFQFSGFLKSIIEDATASSYKYNKIRSKADIEEFNNYLEEILDDSEGLDSKTIRDQIHKIYNKNTFIGYIGLIDYYPKKDNTRHYLGIRCFMILPEYQDQGHGSIVINDIVNRNKDKYDEISCWVEKDNTGAIRFYKNNGAKVYSKLYQGNYYYVCFYTNAPVTESYIPIEYLNIINERLDGQEDENDDYSLDGDDNETPNTNPSAPSSTTTTEDDDYDLGDTGSDSQTQNDNQTQSEPEPARGDDGENSDDDYDLNLNSDNETPQNDNESDQQDNAGDDDYTLEDPNEGDNNEDGQSESEPAQGDGSENSDDDYDLGDAGNKDNEEGSEPKDDDGDGSDNEPTQTEPDDESIQVPNLRDVEKQLFDQLTPEQQKIKSNELKTNFAVLYEKCANILELISNANPSDNNVVRVFDYVSKTITDLQSHIYYYITNTYDTKSYLENDAQFKQFLAILGTIKGILKEVNNNKTE